MPCCVLWGPAGLKAALGGTCFCSDDDSLVLEDEGARMVLRSECDALSLDAVVTGVFVGGGFVCGLCGKGGTHNVLRSKCDALSLDALVTGVIFVEGEVGPSAKLRV